MSATRRGGPAAARPPTGTSRFAAPDQRAPRTPVDEPVPDVAKLPAHTTIVDGELLREARRRHQISRETLAWDAGIGIATLARLERRPPAPRCCRERTLARLAAALGEPPAALVPPDLVTALGLGAADAPSDAGPDQPAEPAADSEPVPMSA
jgi:transcriptional regulator with XRE-family HTH domain